MQAVDRRAVAWADSRQSGNPFHRLGVDHAAAPDTSPGQIRRTHVPTLDRPNLFGCGSKKGLRQTHQLNVTRLKPGDNFPLLSVSLPGGEQLALPEAVAGRYAVVLFYRGSWCPYCNAQLRAFQRAAQSLAAVNAIVVALSVDDEATTAALVERHRLEFAVGYGADAVAINALTGAFVNPDPLFLQSTGFLLGPDGKVLLSVYSSGAIGRLVAEDVVGLITYLTQHMP